MFILQLPNLPFRALLAALLLAPMLNGAAVSAKEEATDPRSLLTTVQIEKILDEPFRPPERTTAPAAYRGQPSGTECDYNTQKGPTRKVVFIAYLDPSVAQAKTRLTDCPSGLPQNRSLAASGTLPTLMTITPSTFSRAKSAATSISFLWAPSPPRRKTVERSRCRGVSFPVIGFCPRHLSGKRLSDSTG